MSPGSSGNVDPRTVEGFGEEWAAFTQEKLAPDEQQRLFDQYFSLFRFDRLPKDAEGFDLGCGTGRWAALVAERVGRLHCIDPAAKALAVARRRLGAASNVLFHERDVDHLPFPDGSQDFGYSIGVLHHIPDTQAAMSACTAKLKPGAPFLAYIYYAFDNRPRWFRSLWRLSDLGRKGISRLPFGARKAFTGVIAALVYWPLARTASAFEKRGRPIGNWPLAEYRYRSFYTMRTDALDRFGTRLEQRFSRAEIERMMRTSGLEDIRFRDAPPFWVVCGTKSLS